MHRELNQHPRNRVPAHLTCSADLGGVRPSHQVMRLGRRHGQRGARARRRTFGDFGSSSYSYSPRTATQTPRRAACCAAERLEPCPRSHHPQPSVQQSARSKARSRRRISGYHARRARVEQRCAPTVNADSEVASWAVAGWRRPSASSGIATAGLPRPASLSRLQCEPLEVGLAQVLGADRVTLRLLEELPIKSRAAWRCAGRAVFGVGPRLVGADAGRETVLGGCHSGLREGVTRRRRFATSSRSVRGGTHGPVARPHRGVCLPLHSTALSSPALWAAGLSSPGPRPPLDGRCGR